jgi:hypothetical protein
MVYYPRPLHRQVAYQGFPIAGDCLAATTRLAGSVLSLPMHPYLAAEEQFRIVAALDDSSPAEGRRGDGPVRSSVQVPLSSPTLHYRAASGAPTGSG